MAFVRGQERLVYESVKDYLTAQLTTLGWIGSSDWPFGAQNGTTVTDVIPDTGSPIEPNRVAFTSGAETDKEEELGAASGGLFSTEHVFFIDIFGENQGIAKALQADVRAILTGRLPGTNRYIPFVDKTVTPNVEAPGHLLHFESVETDTPLQQLYKLDWRVVKVTAVHEYNAVEVGA